MKYLSTFDVPGPVLSTLKRLMHLILPITSCSSCYHSLTHRTRDKNTGCQELREMGKCWLKGINFQWFPEFKCSS